MKWSICFRAVLSIHRAIFTSIISTVITMGVQYPVYYRLSLYRSNRFPSLIEFTFCAAKKHFITRCSHPPPAERPSSVLPAFTFKSMIHRFIIIYSSNLNLSVDTYDGCLWLCTPASFGASAIMGIDDTSSFEIMLCAMRDFCALLIRSHRIPKKTKKSRKNQ